MGTQTPWGLSDFSEKVTRGIMFYGTSSHGGYHVSPTLNQKIHPALRKNDGWYEEDCEYAIVLMSFPELFPDALTAAEKVVKNYFPDAYQQAMGEVVLPEESYKVRQRLFSEQHRADMIVVCAYGDWHKSVPTGMVGVTAIRGGRKENGQYANKEKANYLIARDEYDREYKQSDQGWEFGLVIDENKYQKVNLVF